MWPSQGNNAWSQDPMAQNMASWSNNQAELYQNMPHDQVDWANLAKEWMAMQNNHVQQQQQEIQRQQQHQEMQRQQHQMQHNQMLLRPQQPSPNHFQQQAHHYAQEAQLERLHQFHAQQQMIHQPPNLSAAQMHHPEMFPPRYVTHIPPMQMLTHMNHGPQFMRQEEMHRPPDPRFHGPQGQMHFIREQQPWQNQRPPPPQPPVPPPAPPQLRQPFHNQPPFPPQHQVPRPEDAERVPPPSGASRLPPSDPPRALPPNLPDQRPQHRERPPWSGPPDSLRYNEKPDRRPFQNRAFESHSRMARPSPPPRHPAPPVLNQPLLKQPELDNAEALDAAKKKNLPAWIREGLERMEREKLKQIEREKYELDQIEKLRVQHEMEAEIRREVEEETRRKFALTLKAENDERNLTGNGAIENEVPENVIKVMTDEEREQELMFRVRKTMTQVLLQVTDSEIVKISKDVLLKSKQRKATIKLASNAPIIKTKSGLGGLIAGYGSDSDSEEEDAKEASDDSDSDEELLKRMLEKKRAFAVKEKQMISDQPESKNGAATPMPEAHATKEVMVKVEKVEEVSVKESDLRKDRKRSRSRERKRSRSREKDKRDKHKKSSRHRSRSKDRDSRKRSRSRSRSRSHRNSKSSKSSRRSTSRSRSRDKSRKDRH